MWTKDDLHLTQFDADSTGLVQKVTPESANWGYTSFEVYELGAGQSVSLVNDGRETCAVVISGSATFGIDGKPFGDTTHRDHAFDRKPWAFYAPAGCNWNVTATTTLEVAICGAVASQPNSPFMIAPGDRPIETRGSGNNVRHVVDLLPADSDMAERLLVVEAITPPGCSSSYPPHKHDQDDLPTESQLEEIYFYHIRPEQGFAFQRVYTDDRSLDVTMSPEDGDTILVPKGYHPVSAPHGYEVYYLNVMAGPKRAWNIHTAKEHAWLLES
ncbi:5-deoxy-glucuronate isomerase [Rhodobacteraceae bacterium]|nr:5-deoxy-glucuronate isomerase [Paracoccaceae bacterium]